MKGIKKYFFQGNNYIVNFAKTNKYGGIELDLAQIKTTEVENLETILFETIEHWESVNVRSIYVKIPPEHCNLISNFLKFGFNYHHTKGNDLFVSKWISNGESKIPKYCHHHIGIGAIILNAKIEILLIQEIYSSKNKQNRPLWKFVTGLVEDGESIVEATHREVTEEVNLEINYEGCLIFSELFPNAQQVKDICFFNICSMKEQGGEIQLDKDELVRAKFFTLSELNALIQADEITVATKQTFKKLLPLLQQEKSLEDNLDMLKIGHILRPVVESGMPNFDYYNFYH